MSIQHIWNLSQLLGLFTCRKLANLHVSLNFVTETCKQLLKTTRRIILRKLGTSHDAKGFAICSFLERIVVESRLEQMMTSVRKTLKALALRSLPPKFVQNSHKTTQFLCKFVPKNPAKLTFFAATYQKPWLMPWVFWSFVLINFTSTEWSWRTQFAFRDRSLFIGGGGVGWEINKSSFFPMTPPKKNWIFHAGPPYSIRGAFQSPPQLTHTH